MSPAPDHRAARTVWHVGRSGEVAGGMSQVVNSYLAWPFESWRVQVIPSRDGGRGLRSQLLPVKALARLCSLGSRRSNLVVVHLSQGGSFLREGLLLRAAHRMGYRTVAHLHGSAFVAYAEAQPKRVERVLRAATRIYTLSDETEQAVLRFVSADRVERVSNAVAAGTPTTKRQTVVFGGSVSRRKGVDVLVAAWAKLAPDAGWKLEIVGPFTDADLVDHDLPAATFHGALPHGELMALLDPAALAVLPSRDEAMPMFILEALARRCAVVATRVGGIPDVLSDGAGVLVDAGDVDGLAEALSDLMRNDDRRVRVADAGAEKFDSNYSASALYPRLERSWTAALEAAG